MTPAGPHAQRCPRTARNTKLVAYFSLREKGMVPPTRRKGNERALQKGRWFLVVLLSRSTGAGPSTDVLGRPQVSCSRRRESVLPLPGNGLSGPAGPSSLSASAPPRRCSVLQGVWTCCREPSAVCPHRGQSVGGRWFFPQQREASQLLLPVRAHCRNHPSTQVFRGAMRGGPGSGWWESAGNRDVTLVLCLGTCDPPPVTSVFQRQALSLARLCVCV